MNPQVHLPLHLDGVFFNDVWETARVWSLPTEASVVPFEDLEWHLDLKVWSTVRPEPRWDLSPRTVLLRPDLHPRHWQRILRADLSFPLEMFQQRERWVVLDGYHRLARHCLEQSSQVAVRRHPRHCWPLISEVPTASFRGSADRSQSQV
jgi:hypothetical protein